MIPEFRVVIEARGSRRCLESRSSGEREAIFESEGDSCSIGRIGAVGFGACPRAGFREFCEKHQVIVINQHYANSTAFTFDLLLENGKAAKIPLIIAFHGADLTTIDSAPLAIRKRWRNLLLSSKAVVTCSENLASRVKETFGEDVTSKVICNGVNFAEFLGSAKNPRPSEGRTILSVGKFEEKKGQDILIRAFASLCNLYPVLNLTLVGATDLHLTKLKNLCTEYKIESRVRFFADIPHTEIANFFQSASIFVLPSRQEPFGIVIVKNWSELIEAMYIDPNA